jgi:hypothetical protein
MKRNPSLEELIDFKTAQEHLEKALELIPEKCRDIRVLRLRFRLLNACRAVVKLQPERYKKIKPIDILKEVMREAWKP